MLWPLAFFAPRPTGGAFDAAASEIEFHAPQASHLPDHLEVTLPHSLQLNSEAARAIINIRRFRVVDLQPQSVHAAGR